MTEIIYTADWRYHITELAMQKLPIPTTEQIIEFAVIVLVTMTTLALFANELVTALGAR